MLLKDISFNKVEENILYDEVLLALAEQGKSGEVLRLWESKEYFVVLGRTSKAKEDVNIQNTVHDGIAVLRRASGGGTVLQGLGCLNFSLILSKEKSRILEDIGKSYQYIFGKIIQGFKQVGIDALCQPPSDLVIIEAKQVKKFSGNAQKRARQYILHHGTILYNFDLKKVEKYLTIPKSMPEYRQNRSHINFVTNISLNSEEIKKVLVQVFNAQRGNSIITNEETALLKVFLKAKDVIVNIKGLL